ncbi:laminin G domain-containing protein [Xenococcus sp. PCC 7305]|uniref:LamG-like jellyroll fold domain-containing protein n=1 Tax=Xenococcus sp. PCC 7305 TaxID=102125 RepID=UPI0002ACE87F|nr:LamG-like jellyroll fold domain-containing protein [Xenococcus sp. PCC 7305]ELS02293.1 laminin G domain-containing protein [Xenococcus sp. PCC 7305]
MNNTPVVRISDFTPIIRENQPVSEPKVNYLTLDGVDDRVVIPDSDAIDFAADQDFTVESWIKADPNQGNSSIMEKWSSGGVGYPFIIRYNSTGTITLARYDGSSNPTIISTATINDGEFHHVAFVKEGNDLKLYIDGQLDGTTVDTTTGDTTNTSSLFLGSVNNSFHFKGELDDLRIWNVARTEAEIQQNQDQILNGNESGLVGYWNFNESNVSGNIASDLTGNGNNGDLQNGAKLELDPSFIGYVDIALDAPVENAPGVVVNYIIEGDSTAIQGVDFYGAQVDVSTTDNLSATNSIFIPKGEDTARIYFTALPDAVVEGEEQIKFTLLPDFNNAASFNGTGDYVEINIDEPETEITHELWFKTTDANTGIFSIISGTVAASTGSDRHLYLNNGNLYARVWNNEVINSSGLNLADGEWHHVAHVIGSSVGGQQLYIDGELVDSGTKTASAFDWQTKAIIGYSIDATNDYFNGEIDEVRIWNQARTQDEIRNNRYSQLTGNEPNLFGYWNFNQDQVSGSTINDLSSNNNNGTLVASNKVLSLDGTGDYVEVNIDEPETEITHELWFKTTDANTGIFSIVAGGGSDRHLYLSNGNIYARVYRNEVINSGSLNLADGEWHHLAHVIGSSVGGQKLYIDGELVASGNKTLSDFTLQTQALIGKSVDAVNDDFNGEIDEVRIWNQARTQEQIKQSKDITLTGNEAGLIGYWNFNSSNANDSAGNHNGVLKGNATTISGGRDKFVPSISQDPFAVNGNYYRLAHNRQAIALDGVDDYVNAGTDNSLKLTNAFTIETWVKPESNGHQIILNKEGEYEFAIDANGNVQYAIANTSPGWVWVDTGYQVTFNEWTHLAFTYDASNLNTYANGQLVSTQAATGNIGDVDTGNNELRIGDRPAVADPNFKGEIDEVRVWNLVRSQEQIQDNFDKELTGNEPGLVGYWNFNPESVNNNVVTDLSSNSNNGTVVTNGTPANPFVASTPFTFPSITLSIKDSPSYQAGIAYADSFGDEINASNQLYPDSQGNSSFKVKLTSQPTANVTLALITASGSLDQTSLTFNANNWDSYQTVNVSGLGSIASSFNISSTATSGDSNYNNLSSTLGVLTAAPSNTTKINVTEGGTVQSDPVITANIVAQDAQEGQIQPGTFTVSLSAIAPQGGLTIPYTVSGTAQEGTDYTIEKRKILVLDGVDDRVVIPDSDAIDFAVDQNFTVESWIKADPNQAGTSIMEKWGSGGVGYPFIIRYNGNGTIYAARYDGSSNPTIGSTATINDGQFHHVAFVKDGNNLKLYVDGQLQGTAPDTTTGDTTNTSSLFLGSRNTSYYFKGGVDDLRIWNVARTQADIQQNLNKSLNGTEAGLVGYWNFENDTGTTATDLTSSGNNGALENGASFSLENGPSFSPSITIPEGQKSATISINAINNDIEQGNKNVTVSLSGITDDQGNNLSASLNIVDDEKAGIEFAQLNTVGTLDIPAIELNVTTAYDSATGDIGLQISGGADSYTFATATKFTFSNGTEVTIPANTTINSTATTVNVGTGLGTIAANEDSISEIKLVDVNLLSFTKTGTNATANIQAKLTQAPTTGETVTLTLTDDNGNDTVSFTFDENNWNAYQKTDISNFLDLIANNSTFSLNAQTTSTTTNSNYNSQNLTLPLTTSISATPISINNTSEETKLITSEGDKIEFSVTTAYDSVNNQVELNLINRSTDYTLKANDVITFANGTEAQVTSDTTLTPDTAQNVPVTLTTGTAIPANEAGAISLDNPSQTSFAVKLSSKPSSDVTLNLNLTDATEGEFVSNNGQASTLTFTPANWNQYQEISVQGKDDVVVDGNITYKVKVKGANSNGDSKYQGALGELEIVNEDNDILREDIDPNVSPSVATTSYLASLSVNSTEVNEDGAVTATVNLNQAAPAGGLHVRYQIADITTTPWQDVKTPLVPGIENPLSAARKLTVFEISALDPLPNNTAITYIWAPGSIPNLVDINNDGKLEAFIGESTYNTSPNNWSTGIDYYEQVSGVFEKQSTNNNPFNQFNITANNQAIQSSALAPVFGDVDGDGDIDAVVGDLFGKIHYLKNIGDASNPNFQEQTGNANPLAAVNNPFHLVPTLVDIDNDGDLDFFGSSSGLANAVFTPGGFPVLGTSNIIYFENTGTTTNPLFVGRTGNDNPFNNLTIPDGAALVFGDMDEDGDLDGLSGISNSISSSDGTIAYYRNIGNAQNPVFEFAPEYNPLAGVDVGNLSRLGLADIDKDSDLDVFIGNYDGEIKFYENNSSVAEVYIPEGQTSANITVDLNDDDINENSEKFALQLVDRIDGAVTLKVSAAYQLISGGGKSFNAVGLQVNSSDDLDTYTLPKGTILTFGNGAKVTVDDNTSVNKTGSVLVPVTLTSGTEILVDETTTINKSDYHTIIDLEATSAFDSATDTDLQLQINTTGLTSYTLKQGTQLDFIDSNGDILSVTVDANTNIGNSSSTAVPVTFVAQSSLTTLAANTIGSVQESLATITILDNDTSGVRITTDAAGNNQITGTYTTTETGNSPKTFYARLETEPQEPVFVYLGSNNIQEGTLSAQNVSNQELVKLTFDRTNWQTPQAFTVTGVNDDLDDGNISYKLITTVESEDFHYREDAVKLDVTQDYANGAVNLQVDELNIEKTQLPQGTKLSFNNGTIATVQSKSFVLDGVNDYVEINIDEPETEITHELWFKTTDANTGIFSIISGTVTASTGSDRHLYLNNGNIYARVHAGEVINSNGLNLADGQWHHLAHVIGSSVGGQKLYIDGQLVDSGTKTASDFNWQTKALIGYSIDATNDYFNGEIQDVRIWNQARTQQQIQQNQNTTFTGNEVGLIAYYNDATGIDRAGNDNNGTKIGFSDVDINLSNTQSTNVDILIDPNALGNGATTSTGNLLVTQAYNPTKNTVELRNTTANPLTLNAGDTITFTNGAVLTVNATTILSENSRSAINATLTTSANTITSGATTIFTEDISPDINLSNTDDDTAGVIVDNFENIAATEGVANNFYKVKLPTQPIDTVEVTMTPSDNEISLEDQFPGEPLTITFNETNWDTPQTIGVTAVDDFEIEFDHTSLINFDSSTSTDPVYQNLDLTNTQVKVNITDNDLPTASVKAVAGAIEANAPGYFVITLDKALPTDFDATGLELTYTVAGSADTDGVNPTDDLQPITGVARIAPGETRTPLIAFPIDDFKVEGVPLDVTTAYNNGTIQVEIADNADVNLASLNAGTELTFSNGAIATVDTTVDNLSKTSAKTVNITFSDDSSVTTIPTNASDPTKTRIPAETVTVTLNAGNGYNLSSDQNSDTLEIIDNDVPGIRIVETSDRTTVTERQSGEYFISLLSEPTDPVTVNINPQQTSRQLIVTTAYGNNSVELKVNDTNVDSLVLKQGTVLDFGNNVTANVSQDTLINSEAGTDVAVNLTSGAAIATNATTDYSYDELSTTQSLTFNSNNWYKLQAVTVTGIDDNVVEKHKTHTSTITYDITSSDPVYDGLKTPAQPIDIIDRSFDRDNTVQSLTQGFLAFQDSLDLATLPIIGSLNGITPTFVTNILDDTITEIRSLENVTGEGIATALQNALTNQIGAQNSEQFSVDITDLSSNNLAFAINANDSFTTQIGLGTDLGLAALGLSLQTQGNLDATFDYNLDFAFGLDDTNGFYLNTDNTNFNVIAGLNLSNDFSATGSLGFLEANFTNGLDPTNGDNDGTGVNATFDISISDPSPTGDNKLNLGELDNLRKNKQLADALNYDFSGSAALDFDVVTSVGGNNNFPSFSFNLYSDLPLFNYSDDTEVPENPVTLTVNANKTVTENVATNLNLKATGQDITLKKGTPLTFGSTKVIVQNQVSLSDGTNTNVSVKLKGTDNKNHQETANISQNSTLDLAVSSLDIEFNGINLDFGTFVTGIVSPVVELLDDIITPIEPVITALNSPIGFLKDVGLSGGFDSNGDGQATILEVAEKVITNISPGSKNKIDYVKFFDAIVGLVDLVAAVEDIKTSLDSGDNLTVDFGDYTLSSFQAASQTTSAAEIDPQTQGTNSLKSNTKNQAKNKGGNNSFGQKVDKLFASLDKLGISLPILEDPLTAVNLFLGRDIELLTYDVPELDIQFDINKSFPIFGPLFGVIEGGFSVFSDLVFGFDTVGLSAWKDTNFDGASSHLIFDGLYLNDIDPNTGVDVDELSADATLGIGGKLNAVIASASAIGGITGQVGLDVIDIGEYTGTSDGKIRGSEVISRINNPLSLFELAGSIEAFFKAIVKVGVDLGFVEITKTVFEKELARIPLFEFSLGGSASGTAASGYIDGATVFLDANFNQKLDPDEPSTLTNERGQYNLEFDMRSFDINGNGTIDLEEAQIVAIGGIDVTTGLPLETPLIASSTDGSIISPLTTIKTELERLGLDAIQAEELLQQALGIEVDIDEFDPYEAEGAEYIEAAHTALAHILVHGLLVNGSAFLDGVGFTGNANAIVTESIIELLQSSEEVEFEDADGIEQLFHLVLEKAQIDTVDAATVESVAKLIGAANDFMSDLLESEAEEHDEEDHPALNDVFPNITPVKQLVLGEIPELVSQLSAGDIILDQALESLDEELKTIGFQLVMEEEEEDGKIEMEYEIGFFNPDSVLEESLFSDAGIEIIRGSANGEYLSGSDADDQILGAAGSEIINGGTGNDTILGGDGNDIINGSSGDDLIAGGLGSDIISGGDGADTFVIQPNADIDLIRDFVNDADRLGLADDLSFEQLNIIADGDSTLIQDLSGNTLAVLARVESGLINSHDFTSIDQ